MGCKERLRAEGLELEEGVWCRFVFEFIQPGSLSPCWGYKEVGLRGAVSGGGNWGGGGRERVFIVISMDQPRRGESGVRQRKEGGSDLHPAPRIRRVHGEVRAWAIDAWPSAR